MGSLKTHPHIERPSEKQLQALVKSKSPLVRELYFSVHRLVIETLPEVTYSVDCKDAQIGYGVRQYGYDGWGMAALAPYTNWVSLGFLRGAFLNDPANLLEGSGNTVRHVKVRSLAELSERSSGIRKLIKSAKQIKLKRKDVL